MRAVLIPLGGSGTDVSADRKHVITKLRLDKQVMTQ